MAAPYPSRAEPGAPVSTIEPAGVWAQLRNHAREYAWILTGRFTLLGANAALMLLLVRLLEIETYGLLMVTISAQLLISRVVLMGVDAGMVRLTGVAGPSVPPREVVAAGLTVMRYTTAALVVLALAAAPVLSSLGVSLWLCACIVAGAIGTSRVDYACSVRLTEHRFPLAALAQGGTAVARLGLTLAAATLVLPSSSNGVFGAYHGVSLFAGVCLTAALGLRGPRPDRAVVRRLLDYSRWHAKSSVVVIFTLSQGTFLLMLLGDRAATGTFGLGLTVSLGFFAIYSAYAEYLRVRIRSVADRAELSRFLRRSIQVAVVLSLACVPAIALVAAFLAWMLAPELSPVVTNFRYLSAAMVLLILHAPFEAVCHYLMRPQWVTVSCVARALVIGVAGFMLAPRMSAAGAAIAQLIGSVSTLIILVTIVEVGRRRATLRVRPSGGGWVFFP